MAQIQGNAQQRPCPQNGPPSRRGLVETKDAHRAVICPIQDVCASRKIVELFRGEEVASVEDGAEDPGRDADVRQHDVEGPQGVGCGNESTDFIQAVPVRPEVSEGEEHAEGLLHTQEAVERPFSVELVHWLVGEDALVRDDVLACVVAFGSAIPK